MFVEIYGTPSCSFCVKAKKLVEQHNIEYAYADVSDAEERANMNLRLGFPAKSVPQIFVDGIHLEKGFNQLNSIINTKS